MSVLFWLSITLWLVSLVCYALILNARELRQRRVEGTPAFVPLDALLERAGHSRGSRYLYRTLMLSAAGAMLCGALYLVFGM